MPQKDNQFWAQFLPEIKKTIEGTLAGVEAREKILDSLAETSAGTFPSRLDASRARMESHARRPEETIAEADALLQEAEAEYRSKLADIESLRQKLADWAGRAIR
jgi:hypothetical protein